MPTGRELWLLQPRISQLSENLMARVLCGDSGAAYDDWSPLDWRLARVVGSLHGILAPLGAHCAHAPFGPADWQAFVAEQHRLGLARVARILDLFERILGVFQRGAIDVMPLKGCDLLTRVYAEPAVRSTSDIDLLVQYADFKRAVQLLDSLGFECTSDTDRHAVFMQPQDTIVAYIGEHPENPVKVELHREATVGAVGSSIDLTASLWEGAAVDTWRGLRVMRPTLAALAAHVLLHAAADMQYQAFRGCRLFDLMRLNERLSKEDWQLLAQIVTRAHGGHLAYAALALAQRYVPDIALAHVLEFLAPHATTQLRRHMARATLCELSYCSVRSTIVLDQLKWATGVRAAVDVILSGIYPSKEQRQTWTGSLRHFGHKYDMRHYYARLVRLFARQRNRPSIERLFALID
jgi:Uncharacterised nucleotidyltransferase